MEERKGTIELRGFMQLNQLLKKKFGSMPVIIELDQETTGADLAKN